MSIDLPGFADPVHASQTCFRAVLDAMSRPGTVRRAAAGLIPPAPLSPAAAAVLLTLVDHDTPLWLAGGFAPAADWIAFHCGPPCAALPGDAAFVLASGLPDLDRLRAGTDDGPETSATVVLDVRDLAGAPRWRLTGPGIESHALLPATGLPDDFVARWQRNRARFPRGVDLILCAGDRVASLPRGITVTEA